MKILIHVYIKNCVAINTDKDYDNKNIYKDCVAINIYIKTI